jgi:hypothetical protein
MPTVQELEQYAEDVNAWAELAKEWTGEAIAKVSNNQSIGSNPPTPPPPPPGTSYQ